MIEMSSLWFKVNLGIIYRTKNLETSRFKVDLGIIYRTKSSEWQCQTG